MVSKFLKIFVASAIIVVPVTAVRAAEPLLYPSDFTYTGAFKLPSGNFGMANGSFDYSGAFTGGAVYNDPTNGKSLFITGYLSAGYVSSTPSVAQVKIPATIKDPNVVGDSGLTTATVLQGFSDPSGGKGAQALNGNGFLNTIVYNGKLIGTEETAYDANCAQTKSAWVSPITFSQSSQATGAYKFSYTAVSPRFIGGGFMALIPPEWQSLLGGKVVSGGSPASIISCGPAGPSLHVIDADALAAQPAATTVINSTPLVYYTDGIHSSLGLWNSNLPNQTINGKQVPTITVTDPHGRGNFTIPYFDNTSNIHGVLFPDGTSSVIFFGRKGLGPYCYGVGSDCHDADDPGGKGDHAYPYTEFAWFYDVNDLIAVKNGTKNPWDIYPYTGWAFKVPLDGDGGNQVGMAWDPATRLAYMTVGCSTGVCDPVVHVFSVSAGSTSNPTPVVGDINQDHIVNAIDYSILNAHWFQVYAQADLNSDGLVNAIDYSILNANWFRTW